MATGPSTASTKESNISTFVFLDFESTSLLDRKCRITELCMIAVNRVDMKEAGSFPRVTNKLTLCLDPQRPISMTSSNITGLYNDSLENQKAFTKETVALINAFLNHLSKPVCLLAHNGNRFDFPLLVSELKRINQSLDSLLLCADTLEAFRSLDGLPAKYVPLANQSTGKKYQNSPNRTDTTPAKSATSYTFSPLKRKGTNDLDASNNQSPKVSRQDPSQDMKLSAEKVKKKLNFETIESDKEKAPEESVATNIDKNAVEHKEDLVEEFSASLADDDYLFALENVEKELCKETLVFVKNEYSTRTTWHDTKNENEQVKSTSSSVSNPKVFCKSPNPCSVAYGTGYYVRQNTNEDSVTDNSDIETGDFIIECSDKDGDSASTSAETVNKSTTTSSATRVNNSVSHSRNDESSKGTKAQVSCTETNFVVTLRPNQNSPMPVQARNGSSKSTEPACNSSASVLSTSDMCQSKSANHGRVNSPMISESVTSPASKSVAIVSNSCKSSVTKVEAVKYSDSGGIIRSKVSDMGCAKDELTSVSVPFAISNEPNSSKSGSTLVSLTDVHVSCSSKSGLNGTSVEHIKNSPKTGSTPIPSGNITSSSKSVLVSGTNVQNGSPNIQRQSYKLEEIYLRKFGSRPPQSHKAEDDCVTLLKIAKCSPGFIEWVDKNSELLSTINLPF